MKLLGCYSSSGDATTLENARCLDQADDISLMAPLLNFASATVIFAACTVKRKGGGNIYFSIFQPLKTHFLTAKVAVQQAIRLISK